MSEHRPPPRAHKAAASRSVSVEIEAAVISERAAAVARGLMATGTKLEEIARVVAEWEGIASQAPSFGSARARLIDWAGQPTQQRRPRLGKLLAACANATRRPEDLPAQLTFLKRIYRLAAMSVALGVGISYERENSGRLARAKSVREHRQ